MMKKILKENSEECIFCQVVKGQKHEEILYVDDNFIVFKDNAPVAPVHLLIVPKVHIDNFLEITDPYIRNALFELTQKLILDLHLNETEYTFGFHGGRNQTVMHVHAQLIGNMGSKLVL
jgi:histidine triad (HIT) family protein